MAWKDFAMAEAALAYDTQLVSISETVRHFGKLLEDIVEVKQFVPGEAAGRVQGLIREIAQSSRESLPALSEKAAEIAETLQAFNAQSKVERAKTAKTRVTDVTGLYEKECWLFMREEKGRLGTALEREVQDSIANPPHIRNVLENTARIVQEKQEKLAISQREHAVIWNDQIARLAAIAEKARDTFKLLQRVCAKHESGATYFINANMTTPEEIEQAVSEIRDLVSYSIEKEEKDVAEGKITRELLKKKHRKKNGDLYETVRKILYKTIFKAPSIQFRHPAIAAGQKIRVERKNVSEGQSTALKLLLLVRLAEFSKERDARHDTPVARHRRKVSGHEHSFIILDGIFSNLSDDSLIDESLKALGACKGVFQLIGLIHNKGYVNNYDIFPTFVVAKPFKSEQSGLSQDYWYDVECCHNGQTGLWHSTIVGKHENQQHVN